MDGRQQERILHWLEEEEEEILGGEYDEDGNHIYPDETSEHNTDSEQECDDGDPETQDHVSESSEDQQMDVDSSDSDDNEPLIHITRRQNIVTEQPGPQGTARAVSNPFESWLLFLDVDMLQHIVECTNIKIASMQTNYERQRDCEETNIIELKALIGIMYLIGIHKSSHALIDDIWMADGTGLDKCRASMSKQRFRFLLRVLRFDNIHTREQRKAVDKLAPIREIFEQFVKNCQINYKNTEYVTIDEMLESFRGSCGFRQYMPSKPAKYGIKLFSLVDAMTFYTKNLEIYVGKQPEGPYFQDTSTKALVKRMIEPISGTGRNVTMDNWFTSVPLAEDLLTNHNLTVVGTLRKNKPEIPSEFKRKGLQVHSTAFGYKPTETLLSYCPKKDKTVLLLSTMHNEGIIDETSEKKIPEIIIFYNKTKGGVDVVDKLIGTYTVARVCYRWPLRLFFTMLDVGAVNAHIILNTVNPNNRIGRKLFLKTLAFELCRPQLESRATISTLPRELKQLILRFVPRPVDVPHEDTGFVPTRKRLHQGNR
ncbi:unnamed protein product [Parnassius mnemosyne]|uniref:PiggyBac transposable element-derived protein domain-containing protein n=1 Tax=Parnassius mnemosyne TaxID=213953 RepID=A0AAV1KGA8_9NEOP